MLIPCNLRILETNCFSKLQQTKYLFIVRLLSSCIHSYWYFEVHCTPGTEDNSLLTPESWILLSWVKDASHEAHMYISVFCCKCASGEAYLSYLRPIKLSWVKWGLSSVPAIQCGDPGYSKLLIKILLGFIRAPSLLTLSETVRPSGICRIKLCTFAAWSWALSRSTRDCVNFWTYLQCIYSRRCGVKLCAFTEYIKVH